MDTLLPTLAKPAVPTQAVAEAHRLATEAQPSPSWFAVHTRSNHERVATERLLQRGIDAYLPVLSVRSRRRDRVSVFPRPLFPGYFFVRCDASLSERVEVLKAPGVVRILGFDGRPTPVPAWQIDSLKAALGSGNTVEVLWNLTPGRRVRVINGALAGVEGVVRTSPDGRRRLIVSIELLGRSVAVRIAREQVQPLI